MSDQVAIILTGHMFTKEELLVTAEELLLLGQSTTAKENASLGGFLTNIPWGTSGADHHPQQIQVSL